MDIKKQAVNEYLTQGFTYRQLAAKYGVAVLLSTPGFLFTRELMICPAASAKILTTFSK